MKKSLLAFNVLILVYLVGYSIFYFYNHYNNQAHVESLVDVRKTCTDLYQKDFKSYVQCLQDKSQITDDPVARPIVALPPADFNRSYKIGLKPKDGSWKTHDLKVERKGDILTVDLYKEADKIKNSKDDLAGLLWVVENQNFGEITIEQKEDYSLPLLFYPYNEEGFILFDLHSSWLSIMTSDMPTEEIDAKIKLIIPE